MAARNTDTVESRVMDFKDGDPVMVELRSHVRMKYAGGVMKEKPSNFKKGIFRGYHGPRVWVEIQTIEGIRKRSFAANKVTKITKENESA